MHLYRLISEPIRTDQSWDERWAGPDGGLIACWERGREMSAELSPESLEATSKARRGELVVLPWKGGVEKALKKKQKYGTHFYLAMWLGLRGEDLAIDTDAEPTHVCTATNVTVIYTNDYAKYSQV